MRTRSMCLLLKNNHEDHVNEELHEYEICIILFRPFCNHPMHFLPLSFPWIHVKVQRGDMFKSCGSNKIS
jgi:hypothetical protein